VPFRGRDHAVHRVGAVALLAELETAFQPLLIRDKRNPRDARLMGDALQNFLGVGELGEVLRVGERGDFNRPDAGLDRRLDEPNLQLGRDELILVLEPVPGPAVGDRHCRRCFHGVPHHIPNLPPAQRQTVPDDPDHTVHHLSGRAVDHDVRLVVIRRWL